jgi:hypothetical protein
MGYGNADSVELVQDTVQLWVSVMAVMMFLTSFLNIHQLLKLQ